MSEFVDRHRQAFSRVASIAAGLLFLAGAVAAYNGAERQYYAREAEQAVRSLIASSQTAFITLNKDGIITDWPGPAAKMFGWTRNEMVGSNIERLMPEEFRELHRVGFASVMADPEAWKNILRIQCTAVTKSGKNKDVIVTTRITPGPDGPLAVASIDKAALVRDLTGGREE